jgi:protein-S-isoprenylcysteine O-methyltransferase Ste14
LDPTIEPTESTEPLENDFSVIEIGEKLFQWRDYTPIPIIILFLAFAAPNVVSATIGTLVIMVGEMIRLYSVAFIGSVSRTRSSSLGQALVTRGPFAIVRNPLYVGNFFIVLGFGIFCGRPLLLILAMAAFAFQYHCIVKYEESLLVQRFGAEFQRYRDTVPAWLPLRLPDLAELESPDTLIPALRSEKRTLTAIFALMFVLLLVNRS